MPSLTCTCSRPDFLSGKATLSHLITVLVLMKENGGERWTSSWISSRRRLALTGKIVSLWLTRSHAPTSNIPHQCVNLPCSMYIQDTNSLQAVGKPVGRRLRHDIDYCRQINAEILGLPWPPVENSDSTENPVENESDAGPGAFGNEDVVMTSPSDPSPISEEDSQDHEQEQDQDSHVDPRSLEVDEQMMASPPESDGLPAEDDTRVMQSTETEPCGTQSGRRLESPPQDEEVKPEGILAVSSPLVPDETPTSPTKPATPAPSIDEYGISESSSNPLVHFDKETGMEMSLEFEPREPLT